MRTYLVRMAGKWTSGARQQKLRVPERTLYNAQWDDGSLLERPGSFVSLQWIHFAEMSAQIQGEVRLRILCRSKAGIRITKYESDGGRKNLYEQGLMEIQLSNPFF